MQQVFQTDATEQLGAHPVGHAVDDFAIVLRQIDVHGTLAHHFVLPTPPAFLNEPPGLQLHLSEGDRLVDLVREDVDCVLRLGKLQDSTMVGRRIALLGEVTCASPAYVATARLGLGMIQVPRYHVAADFAAGTLVAVLPDCPPSPTPVSLLYPHNRQLSPRVQVFIDWVARAFGRPDNAGTPVSRVAAG